MYPGQAGDVRAPTARRGRGWAWLQGVALTLPVLGAVATPVFARAEPRLFGVPFFHWYQLAWVPFTAACLACGYLAHRARRTDPPH
jgi:hypothetical protein